MDEIEAGSGSRSQAQPGTGGGRPADRISSLPDDLLLEVLSHLRYPSAAARTTLLSRRWRGLSAQLPSVDVTLRDVPLDSLVHVLRRAARPGLRLLDIDVRAMVAATTTVSSVLREAASLSPVQLRFALPLNVTIKRGDRDLWGAVNLPSFHRATSIDLRAPPSLLTQSWASTEFPALERLSLSGCHLDLEALIPRCPRLRELSLAGGATDFTIQSFSLQGLVVDSINIGTRSIIVQAPMLEQLTMSFHANRELSVSIFAPMVEKVSWRCWYPHLTHRLGLWDLLEVSLQTTQGTRHSAGFSNIDEDTCSQLPRVNVLSLRMCTTRGSFHSPDGEMRFAAEIAKHMVTDFSSLELRLTTRGHAFGSFAWRILGMHLIRKVTRSLRIVLLRSEVRVACQPNCPCDAPWNWRTQLFSLPNLEKLEIIGFEGEDQDFDFLKLVFRRARMLRRVTVRLPDQDAPNGDWCTKLHDIFAAYPYVEGNIDLIPSN